MHLFVLTTSKELTVSVNIAITLPTPLGIKTEIREAATARALCTALDKDGDRAHLRGVFTGGTAAFLFVKTLIWMPQINPPSPVLEISILVVSLVITALACSCLLSYDELAAYRGAYKTAEAEINKTSGIKD